MAASQSEQGSKFVQDKTTKCRSGTVMLGGVLEVSVTYTDTGKNILYELQSV